jgi:hypothetical protein
MNLFNSYLLLVMAATFDQLCSCYHFVPCRKLACCACRSLKQVSNRPYFNQNTEVADTKCVFDIKRCLELQISGKCDELELQNY